MSVTTFLPFSIFMPPVSETETETEILDPVENLQERFLLSTLVEALDHTSPRDQTISRDKTTKINTAEVKTAEIKTAEIKTAEIKTVELTGHSECRKTWSQLVSSDSKDGSKNKSSRSIRRNRVRARRKNSTRVITVDEKQGQETTATSPVSISPVFASSVTSSPVSTSPVSTSPVTTSSISTFAKVSPSPTFSVKCVLNDYSPIDPYIYERDDSVLMTLPTTPCRWIEKFGKCPLKQGCPFRHDNVAKKTR